MSKKSYKQVRFDYEDEDRNFSSKKKVQQEKQRKQQRNMKNVFRSKSFDADRYTSEFED